MEFANIFVKVLERIYISDTALQDLGTSFKKNDLRKSTNNTFFLNEKVINLDIELKQTVTYVTKRFAL